MTTYHPPHSGGPGTFLPLKEFKAYYGADWKAAKAHVDLVYLDAVTAYKVAKKKANPGYSIWNPSEQNPVPGAINFQHAIVNAQKYQVYTPPKGWQVALSKLGTTAIKSATLGAIGGGLAVEGTKIGNDLVGEQGMSFIDDINGDFQQISSLIGSAKNVYHQATDFGNAGGTGSGAPQYNPGVMENSGSVGTSGIPTWIWIVGAAGIAYLILRK